MISGQSSLAHGTNHQMTNRFVVLVTYRHCAIISISRIQINVEDFQYRLLDFDQPFFA